MSTNKPKIGKIDAGIFTRFLLQRLGKPDRSPAIRIFEKQSKVCLKTTKEYRK